MDFIDRITGLSSKVEKLLPHLETEEATKNALIMPFIGALGYDVFDPTVVVPEFTADVGIKKGEKVDYAVMYDGQPIMLFECKAAHCNLDNVHASQLYRYFSVTQARISVLTNGVTYRFFSDLEEPNKMDQRPFLEFDMLDVNEPLVKELKKLTRDSFNLEEMVEAAGELKYTRAIKQFFGQQLSEPSEEFVRYVTGQVYSGRITQNVREQFTPIVKRALTQFISERISERLQSAIDREEAVAVQQHVPEAEPAPASSTGDGAAEEPEEGVVYVDEEKGIVTTEEEMEAYRIVKAIVSQVVAPSRVAHRDVKSYFSVLLDDNNRKPICRLHFHRQQWQIGLFHDGDEERVDVDSPEDIYQYAEQLRAAVEAYEEE